MTDCNCDAARRGGGGNPAAIMRLQEARRFDYTQPEALVGSQAKPLECSSIAHASYIFRLTNLAWEKRHYGLAIVCTMYSSSVWAGAAIAS